LPRKWIKVTPWTGRKRTPTYRVPQYGRWRWSFFAQVVIVGYTRNGVKGFFGKKVEKRIFIKQARQIWPAGGEAISANLW
jgi:hypothetical protein